jgi:hypothetical protein
MNGTNYLSLQEVTALYDGELTAHGCTAMQHTYQEAAVTWLMSGRAWHSTASLLLHNAHCVCLCCQVHV